MGPAGYKRSQRQTVRRPHLVALLVLTSANWGGGLSQSGVCPLCGSTRPLWLELLAGQRVGSWGLGSWILPTRGQAHRVPGGQEGGCATCPQGSPCLTEGRRHNPVLKESRGQHGHRSWCLGSPALIGLMEVGENGFCIGSSSEIHGFGSAGPGHLSLRLPCTPRRRGTGGRPGRQWAPGARGLQLILAGLSPRSTPPEQRDGGPWPLGTGGTRRLQNLAFAGRAPVCSTVFLGSRLPSFRDVAPAGAHQARAVDRPRAPHFTHALARFGFVLGPSVSFLSCTFSPSFAPFLG